MSMSLNLYFISNDHSLIISLVVWETIFLVVLLVFNDLCVGWYVSKQCLAPFSCTKTTLVLILNPLSAMRINLHRKAQTVTIKSEFF